MFKWLANLFGPSSYMREAIAMMEHANDINKLILIQVIRNQNTDPELEAYLKRHDGEVPELEFLPDGRTKIWFASDKATCETGAGSLDSPSHIQPRRPLSH